MRLAFLFSQLARITHGVSRRRASMEARVG